MQFVFKMGDIQDKRLDVIEAKLDQVIELLTPVHSHAAWVDSLRSRLASMRLLPSGRNEEVTTTPSRPIHSPPQISLS